MAAPGRKRTLFGLLLVVVGAIFLLDNLGFEIDLPYYVFSWPAIFVVLGVINLLSGNGRSALIFFGLSTIFYLQYFDVLDLQDLWPVIIILVGLSYIFRKKAGGPHEAAEDTFDEVAIFGGTEKKFVSQNFKGGKITCIFGGAEINLREATTVDGAYIEVFCLFGGVDIKVPENWNIQMDNVAILGGFSDERKTSETQELKVDVKVKGFVMFGGGEIRN